MEQKYLEKPYLRVVCSDELWLRRWGAPDDVHGEPGEQTPRLHQVEGERLPRGMNKITIQVLATNYDAHSKHPTSS